MAIQENKLRWFCLGMALVFLVNLLIDSLIVVCERASPHESVFGVWAR